MRTPQFGGEGGSSYAGDDSCDATDTCVSQPACPVLKSIVQQDSFWAVSVGDGSVVNDSKGELCQEAIEKAASKKWGGHEVDGRMLPMDELSKFGALINRAPKGDQDPLRKAAALMNANNITPAQLVALGPVAIERALSNRVLSRTGGVVKGPKRLANRILLCIRRLAQQFPQAGLPVPANPSAAVKIPLLKLDDEPEAFRAGLAAWLIQSNEERGQEEGAAQALSVNTRRSYAQAVRQCLAIANELGFVVDGSFSLMTLSRNDVAGPVLDELDVRLTTADVAAIVAALTRIAGDLYRNHSDHHEHINSLRAETARRFPSQALDAEKLKGLDDQLADRAGMRTLLNAPVAIMARAHHPSLRPADRIARASAAVALALKLDHAGLTTTDAARLDLKQDLRTGADGLELRLPDVRERGRFLWEPVTPATTDLIAKLWALKQACDPTETLLFPNHAGKPQETRVAMTQVYNEVEIVTGTRMTFPQLKTLACYSALRADPDEFSAIADAARYKDPRSLARRFKAVVNRRRL